MSFRALRDPRGAVLAPLALWTAFVLAGCYLLDTRHNTFAYHYHPDEPGKVEQVITGEWNYHHPMLLLVAAKAAVWVFHVPLEPQAVVQAGRCVSAAFMAGAVAGFSLLAFLWRGWLAAMITAGALAFHHQLFELAHYMKEDSALLFGMALTFLALLAFTQAPSRFRAFALGAACGLATSGKYIGALLVPLALFVIWKCAAPRKRASLGWFAIGAAVVTMCVNLPLWIHLGMFRHSLQREMSLVVEGQGDVTRRVPHTLYWNVFLDNSTPIIWIFLVGFVLMCWQTRHRLGSAQWIILAFPFAFTFALSFSPKENDRYFLPASALFTFIAALGVADSPRIAHRVSSGLGLPGPERVMAGGARHATLAGSTVLLILLQLTGWSATKQGWIAYDAAFQHDDFADLVRYLRQSVPPTAKIAADGRVGFPLTRRNAPKQTLVPQDVEVSRFAADFGPLGSLKTEGFDYIAVSESSYGRFSRSGLRAKDLADQKFAAARTFYEKLLREDALFLRERGIVIYLHPGLRVYRTPSDDD